MTDGRAFRAQDGTQVGVPIRNGDRWRVPLLLSARLRCWALEQVRHMGGPHPLLVWVLILLDHLMSVISVH